MSRRRGGIIVQISSPRFYDLSKVWQVARLNGGVVRWSRGRRRRGNDGNKAFEKNEKLNLSVKTIVVGLRTKLRKPAILASFKSPQTFPRMNSSKNSCYPNSEKEIYIFAIFFLLLFSITNTISNNSTRNRIFTKFQLCPNVIYLLDIPRRTLGVKTPFLRRNKLHKLFSRRGGNPGKQALSAESTTDFSMVSVLANGQKISGVHWNEVVG